MKKYNHLFTLAFSVNSDRDKEAPVDPAEIMEAICLRVIDIEKNGEWDEAIGLPADTYENEAPLRPQAAALKEIRDDIAAFNTECEAEEHTDTGDAWDLFGRISNICERELKNIIDIEELDSGELADQQRQWEKFTPPDAELNESGSPSVGEAVGPASR
jgi:hypothetical protein